MIERRSKDRALGKTLKGQGDKEEPVKEIEK